MWIVGTRLGSRSHAPSVSDSYRRPIHLPRSASPPGEEYFTLVLQSAEKLRAVALADRRLFARLIHCSVYESDSDPRP